MSSLATDSNIGTVKGMYESFAEGDIEAVAATWASDIEFNEPEGFIGGGTFHGSDEIIENAFGVMANVWKEVSVVPEQFVEGGDTVVALYTWSGTSTETGKSVEFPGAHVFKFKDGKIARWRSYGDTALFNAALKE